MDWLEFKIWVFSLSLGEDALHIYAAVAIQVATAAITRRSLGSAGPWWAVLAALTMNEYMDLFHGETQAVEAWQLAGTFHDTWNTMLLPTVLLVLVRIAPSLFRSPALHNTSDD